ncbi:hypothetical protein IQ07DRAFT_678221 [Pyrenochaeta sp. DS3sAY3a]|nr:hypothetical protein IQ07DRAFT_678221 [Pyrenochaeta sp. DS3sAY3a]
MPPTYIPSTQASPTESQQIQPLPSPSPSPSLYQPTYPQRTLLSTHPAYRPLTPSSLCVPAGPPNYTPYFATAQPDEMVQRPTYASSSLRKKVILESVACGLDAAAKAYVDVSVAREGKKEEKKGKKKKGVVPKAVKVAFWLL